MPRAARRMRKVGVLPIGGTAAEFDRYIRADLVRWARIVKERNIKVD